MMLDQGGATGVGEADVSDCSGGTHVYVNSFKSKGAYEMAHMYEYWLICMYPHVSHCSKQGVV